MLFTVTPTLINNALSHSSLSLVNVSKLQFYHIHFLFSSLIFHCSQLLYFFFFTLYSDTQSYFATCTSYNNHILQDNVAVICTQLPFLYVSTQDGVQISRVSPPSEVAVLPIQFEEDNYNKIKILEFTSFFSFKTLSDFVCIKYFFFF